MHIYSGNHFVSRMFIWKNLLAILSLNLMQLFVSQINLFQLWSKIFKFGHHLNTFAKSLFILDKRFDRFLLIPIFNLPILILPLNLLFHFLTTQVLIYLRIIPSLKHLFKYRSSLRQKEVHYFFLNLFFALDYEPDFILRFPTHRYHKSWTTI